MNSSALAKVLTEALDTFHDRPALTSDHQTLTYAGLRRAAERLADVYRLAGLRRGDRVVASMPNGARYLVATMAAWFCGAVHVGVDVEFTDVELSRVVEMTGARLVVRAAEAATDGSAAIPRTRLRAACMALARDGSATPVQSQPLENETVDERWRDAAIIFISSGTTGRPKATVGFDANLSQRWKRLADWLTFGETDVHLAHLPMSHGFGLMMTVAALLRGGRLVTLEHFSTANALHLMTTEHVTVFNGAPTHFKLLLNARRSRGAEFPRLRVCVGTAAAFTPSLVEQIHQELSDRFVHMYGSSEGVGVATADMEDIRLGSVGRPQPGAARIVGDDRRELPAGAIGEIAFSRRVYPVTYWDTGSNADTTSEWFYSGDLGRMDEQGRLYVFGRLKHQIDRGGLKVDPFEVEQALLDCPEVADAAVLGLPDRVLGETVCACVVAREGVVITLEQVRRALGERLASYKLPTTLHVLEAIPRTAIGKTDLQTLRAICTTAAAQLS